ncbi:TPA: tyrosine-type recombinase/integrase [Clostridium botulinum]|uniref:site-specific tyrosine recombinase/integron integrase n=1 Tax=Clostridium botulinum TaxID=1491 RepID=UPI000D0D66B7|nr:site-specific tyrosine recombinase/integron integrase [Clostridium botulinum]PSM00386.1 integrase [Clostridium botulinum]HDK7138915.1 tyrosine-type recombinase/integrase [Clostridium botulinum]HDK7142244.1 tyrosine-type recombinase/integrase [Clostridium botulinum]HDK7144138.1 tyrosine-type recombinase/integrase [Clostridium botulinum]HDK7147790.1 tyrosine-type recombinase/integrase [Clostridium botulinum]
MYSSSSKEEVVIKLVGKLSLEFPEIDQLKVRTIAEEVLYKYRVLPEETALVSSDIEEKLQIYLASKKLDGLSIKTLKNYEYNLLIFADHLRKPLAAINTMDLRMFLAVRCKNMKQTSMNGQISILKSFFGWLVDEEYIPKNPAKKLKQTKEPKRLRRALSEEEVELLRQAAKTDREKALVEFLVSTGCRLSEVVGVDKLDIDWNEMSLFVIGKGNKERKVYFNVKTKICLKKYLNKRKDNNEALFVTSKRPHARLGGRSIQREIKKIAKRTGLEKSIHPHLFRHSYATHNLNSGMPMPILQQLMGHESPATTQIYAELSQENIKHEYKKIS